MRHAETPRTVGADAQGLGHQVSQRPRADRAAAGQRHHGRIVLTQIEPIEDVEGRCYLVGNVLRRMLGERDDVPALLAALVLEPARKNTLLSANAAWQFSLHPCLQWWAELT